MIHVLFVCTGNTCRSPMAEAMLRSYAEREGLPIAVKSAGVSTRQGIPTTEKSQHALQARGIRFVGQSQQASKELVEWADYILTMTESHKQTLMLHFPHSLDKLYTLKQFGWLNEENQARLQQLDEYVAQLQMQFQLGEPLDEHLRQKAIALESELPDFDIVDPFGGSQHDYDTAADEIEEGIELAVKKFKNILKNEH